MEIARILIVEDDEFFAEKIKENLEKNGFNICGISKTGTDAIKKAASTKPHLVLMDIHLSGNLDGVETAGYIYRNMEVPVVYLTSLMNNKILERAKKTEPFGFIPKNIAYDQISIMIEFALYKHKVLVKEREMHRKLIDNQKKFENIVNAARDAIIFIDTDDVITFWNPASKHTFHYDAEEAIGQNFFELLISDEYRIDLYQAFQSTKSGNKSILFENTLELYAKQKEGDLIPVEMSLTALQVEDKWYACAFVRDVTTRIIAEEEVNKLIEEMQVSKEILEQNANELVYLNHKLSESESQLQELNASKDKFFSIIAHDLKGPFQGLLGYSQMLSSDIENLTKEEIADFAKSLNESAEHLFKLLENLLHWSRIQRGVIENNPDHAELIQIVDINIALIYTRAQQKGIELINEVPEALYIYADINMVNTVLRNLLSNAVKFTSEGDKIGVRARELEYQTIEVEVFDTGIGMDKSAREKIFRIDSHHTTPGTNNEQGTGLGLILCKELVEKCRGHIRVDSEPGKGASFRFTLPKGSGENYSD
ncbi:MAG: ATP-binding protein [Candidatus Kapaibacterium sp.]